MRDIVDNETARQGPVFFQVNASFWRSHLQSILLSKPAGCLLQGPWSFELSLKLARHGTVVKMPSGGKGLFRFFDPGTTLGAMIALSCDEKSQWLGGFNQLQWCYYQQCYCSMIQADAAITTDANTLNPPLILTSQHLTVMDQVRLWEIKQWMVREYITRGYTATLIHQAIEQAIEYGAQSVFQLESFVHVFVAKSAIFQDSEAAKQQMAQRDVSFMYRLEQVKIILKKS